MSEKLPRRPKQHVIGDRAVVLVRKHLPPEWVVREQDGTSDYGIDLEVEIAQAVVSGHIFKGQVRGHEQLPWAADSGYLQPVRAATLEYWRAVPVPVVLLVADLGAEAVYWTLVRSSEGESGVRVARSSRLDRTADDLERSVTAWLDEHGANATVASVALFAERWESAKSRLDLDCFLSVPDDVYVEILWLYHQLKLLREALALSHGDLFSWETWVARSRVTFGDAEHLYWGTYDEIMAYLDPHVEEALDAAAHRLAAEDTRAENVVAKSWAESRVGRPYLRYGYRSPLENAPSSFWERMDEQLSQVDARRYRAAEALRHRLSTERNRG